MTTALVKGASAVLLNPRNRKKVRRVARVGGLMALQAVNNRRSRRGKRVLFPAGRVATVVDNFKSGMTATRLSDKPTFVSNTTITNSKSEVFQDTELTTLSVPISATNTLSKTLQSFSPSFSCWGAKLYQKSSTFARYSVNRLQISFVPAVGTGVNGTLWMGWTNNMTLAPSDISSVQDIQSLPVHGDSTLAEGMILSIPCDKMNNNGKSLIRDMGDNVASSGGSLTLYYAGQLCFGTTNVTSGVTQVGTLKVSYIIRGTDPQVDKAPKSMVLLSDGATTSVVRRGMFTHVAGDDSNHFTLNLPQSVTWLVATNHLDDMSQQITLNGTTIGSSGFLDREIAGTNRDWVMYCVPAGNYTVVIAATAFPSYHVLWPHVQSEFGGIWDDLAFA